MSKKQQRVAVAVDLGATNLRVALVREDGKVLKKLVVPTPKKGKSGRVVTDKIIAQIKKLLTGNKKEIVGIGVSSAGPLDTNKGLLMRPTNISFPNVAIVAPLTKAFDKETFLLNDASAAVLGEKMFGSGKKAKNLVYVTISTGIGAGIIVDGHLLHGAEGNAGEVGNFFVNNVIALSRNASGRTVDWGRVASGSKTVQYFDAWKTYHGIVDRSLCPQDASDLYDAAKRGDLIVRKFINDIAHIHACGLSNIIAAYDPEIIVLGGSVVQCNKDVFMRLLKKHMKHSTLVGRPRIIITKLGDNISLLGAAALVFEKHKK